MKYLINVMSSRNYTLGWLSKSGYVQRLGYEVGLEMHKYTFDDHGKDDEVDYILAIAGFKKRYPGLIDGVMFVQKPLEEEEDE